MGGNAGEERLNPLPTGLFPVLCQPTPGWYSAVQFQMGECLHLGEEPLGGEKVAGRKTVGHSPPHVTWPYPLPQLFLLKKLIVVMTHVPFVMV